MLSMKSVASALVLAATAADLAAPILVVPALMLGVSIAAHAAEAPAQSVRIAALPQVRRQASQPVQAG